MRRRDVALALLAGVVLTWTPPAGQRALTVGPSSPGGSAAAAVAPATRLPPCRHGDVAASPSGYRDWARIIVDTTYRLPRGYAPNDLVPVSRAGLPGSGLVRRLVVEDLRALARAARASGVPLAALSGYRSYESQAWSFAAWVRKAGYEQALRGSARAGHSEHQLGTAIDFSSAPGVDPWYYAWFGSRTARWLATNAWKYGFVLSYPAGEDARSCYHHEPWHYRYVGRALAAAVHRADVPLRAYLWTDRMTPAPPHRPPADEAGTGPPSPAPGSPPPSGSPGPSSPSPSPGPADSPGPSAAPTPTPTPTT